MIRWNLETEGNVNQSRILPCEPTNTHNFRLLLLLYKFCFLFNLTQYLIWFHNFYVFVLCRLILFVVIVVVAAAGHAHRFVQQLEYEELFRGYLPIDVDDLVPRKSGTAQTRGRSSRRYVITRHCGVSNKLCAVDKCTVIDLLHHFNHHLHLDCLSQSFFLFIYLLHASDHLDRTLTFPTIFPFICLYNSCNSCCRFFFFLFLFGSLVIYPSIHDCYWIWYCMRLTVFYFLFLIFVRVRRHRFGEERIRRIWIQNSWLETGRRFSHWAWNSSWIIWTAGGRYPHQY